MTTYEALKANETKRVRVCSPKIDDWWEVTELINFLNEGCFKGHPDMQWEVEEPLCEGWEIRRKDRPFFATREDAEARRQKMSTPEDWKVLYFREVRP